MAQLLACVPLSGRLQRSVNAKLGNSMPHKRGKQHHKIKMGSIYTVFNNISNQTSQQAFFLKCQYRFTI